MKLHPSLSKFGVSADVPHPEAQDRSKPTGEKGFPFWQANPRLLAIPASGCWAQDLQNEPWCNPVRVFLLLCFWQEGDVLKELGCTLPKAGRFGRLS